MKENKLKPTFDCRNSANINAILQGLEYVSQVPLNCLIRYRYQ